MPTEEEKKAALEAAKKAQRESIEVNISSKTGEEEVKTEEKEVEIETKAEEEIETKTEEIETLEKTEEELATEKAEAATQKEKDRIQKRIDKEVAKRKILEAENAELKAKLAADPTKENALTEEEVEKRANTKAEEKVLAREFANACNRLFDEAKKVDKDIQKKINAIAEDLGPVPSHLIGIIDDLDNKGDVFAHLMTNADVAEEIYAYSPVKAALELAKLSEKIAIDKKPKPKPISKAPDPNEPIGGGTKTPNLTLSDKDSMDEFVRKRNEQIKQRQERKKAGLRA